MGDKIILVEIEVIQSGLLQIDFKNEKTAEYFRCFAKPDEFFGMIGKSMLSNWERYIQSY